MCAANSIRTVPEFEVQFKVQTSKESPPSAPLAIGLLPCLSEVCVTGLNDAAVMLASPLIVT
jgi:hypothetical protein